MERERLEHCIERALGHTQFRNVWGQSFGASAMHELYPGTSGYRDRARGA